MSKQTWTNIDTCMSVVRDGEQVDLIIVGRTSDCRPITKRGRSLGTDPDDAQIDIIQVDGPHPRQEWTGVLARTEEADARDALCMAYADGLPRAEYCGSAELDAADTRGWR